MPKKRGRRKLNLNRIQSMRVHTRRRVKERYGIEFTASLRKQVIYKIQSGQSIYAGKQSVSRSFHFVDVEVDDETVKMLFIYDKTRNELKTALHLTALKEGTEATLVQ